MLNIQVPLLHVANQNVLVTHMRGDILLQFLAFMRGPQLREIVTRAPRCSPASTPDVPRVCVHVVVPGCFFSDVDILLRFGHLRHSSFPVGIMHGLRSMYACSDAMILALTSSTCAPYCWPVCSQPLPISGSRAFLSSEAPPGTWTEVIDQAFVADASSAATRLRWRPSRYG
ncbi:unnamed protein product, partial [Prorocentrum cordatum]